MPVKSRQTEGCAAIRHRPQVMGKDLVRRWDPDDLRSPRELETLPVWMRVGAFANPTTYVVTGLRQITLMPAPTMGAVANIPLWICFAVTAGFAALGMYWALKAFQKAIK